MMPAYIPFALGAITGVATVAVADSRAPKSPWTLRNETGLPQRATRPRLKKPEVTSNQEEVA